jgi:hypothetical protein
MKGFVRKSVWADVATVAASMRDADVAEIKASTGSTPEEALYRGLLHTAFGGRTMTICLPDGTPTAMFGVAPSGQADVGYIWLLATNDLKKVQTQFIRECRRYIVEISQGYRVVFNFTDARNTLHHRWLKWTGFTFIKRHENYGVGGKPFLEFCQITEAAYV